MPSRSQRHKLAVQGVTSDGHYNPAYPVTVGTALADQTSTNNVADTYTFGPTQFTTAAAALPLTYTAVEAGKSKLPTGMTFNAGTRTFNWTMPTGTYVINVQATNTFNQAASDDFKIVIT